MAEQRSVVLVDGSNVIHSGAWIDYAGSDLHERGKRFVDACAGWAASVDADIVVVFDGTGPFQMPGELQVTPACTIVATVGDTADSWIEREAAVFRMARRSYRVISNDVALRQAAAPPAGIATSSEEFVRELLAVANEVESCVEVEGSAGTAPQGLARLLDAASLEKLERMRRGHP